MKWILMLVACSLIMTTSRAWSLSLNFEEIKVTWVTSKMAQTIRSNPKAASLGLRVDTGIFDPVRARALSGGAKDANDSVYRVVAKAGHTMFECRQTGQVVVLAGTFPSGSHAVMNDDGLISKLKPVRVAAVFCHCNQSGGVCPYTIIKNGVILIDHCGDSSQCTCVTKTITLDPGGVVVVDPL